jgi:hypothetical protein
MRNGNATQFSCRSRRMTRQRNTKGFEERQNNHSRSSSMLSPVGESTTILNYESADRVIFKKKKTSNTKKVVTMLSK